MDASRQLAELLERLRELLGGAAQELCGLVGVCVQLGLSEPEGERERDEALLRPVVEVALEATPLGVTGLQEALARMAQLLFLPLALGDLHAGDEEAGPPVLVEQGVVDHATTAWPPPAARQWFSCSPAAPSAAREASSRRTSSASSGTMNTSQNFFSRNSGRRARRQAARASG
jgi:hypothetical protein